MVCVLPPRGDRSRSTTSRGRLMACRDRPHDRRCGCRGAPDRRPGGHLPRPGRHHLGGPADKSLSEARDRVRMAINNDCGRWPATKRVTILLGARRPAQERDPPRPGHRAGGQGGRQPKAPARPPGPGASSASSAPAGSGRSRASCRWYGRGLARHPRVFVPEPQAHEAALVPGITVFGMRSLAQVVAELRGGGARGRPGRRPPSSPLLVLARRGPPGRRWTSSTSTGGRGPLRRGGGRGRRTPVMLIGPARSGKTSVAERIPTILPDLTVEQALEVSALHSVAGVLQGSGLVRRPPWFAPHHGATAASCSAAAPVACGPGEVSLAHHGVLFLDEFPHFRADVVEALRQPLESGEVTIARGEESATYPARSLVVLAANPCPCGNFHGLSGGSASARSPALPLPPQAHGADRRPGRHLDGGATAGSPAGAVLRPGAGVVRRGPRPGGRARLRQARRYPDCAWLPTPPAPVRSSRAVAAEPDGAGAHRRRALPRQAHPPRADPRAAAGMDGRGLRGRASPGSARPRSRSHCAPTTAPGAAGEHGSRAS